MKDNAEWTREPKMYVPQTPTEAWIFLLILSAFAGTCFDILFRAAWKAIDMKRRWVITLPEVVGGSARMERVAPKRGTRTKMEGDDGRTDILSGDAYYPTNRGPLHLVSANGWNLVAPTEDEPGIEAKSGVEIKKDASRWKRLRIWDSLTYFRACKENDMMDLYSSNKEKEHWIVKLAPIAFILLLVAMGALCFLSYNLLKTQGGA